MWALILTSSLLGQGFNTGSALENIFMPGFATYDLCVEAGNQIPAPPSNHAFKGSAKFICVRQK